MALVHVGESIVVDDETGEVVEGAVGADATLRLVRRALHAKDQYDRWGAIYGACRAALCATQTEKTAIYPEAVVTVRQNVYTKADATKFSAWLTSIEAPREVLMAVIAASKVDAKQVKTMLATDGDAPTNIITYSPGKPFVLIERVAEQAPPQPGEREMAGVK